MKLYFNSAKNLSAFENFLFFGPDEGKKIDLLENLKETLARPDDPLEWMRFGCADILKNPLSLRENLESASLLGTQNLVIIDSCTDKLAPLIEPLFKRAKNHKLVMLSSTLTSASKLKAACEKDKNTAAIGCYADAFDDVQKALRIEAQNRSLRLTEEGEALLLSSLGDDYLYRKNVLKRLFDETPKGTMLDATYLKRYVGSAEALKIDELLYRLHTPSALTLTLLENHVNEEPHGLLRMMQKHFLKLFHVLKEEKTGQERALSTLTPPIMFMFQKAFKEQLVAFSLNRVIRILKGLQDIEILARQSTDSVKLVGPSLLALLYRSQE